MNVRCVYSSKWPKRFGADAITLYPFILFDCTKEVALDSGILKHEVVHVRQVRTLGWFRFYASYVWQYLQLRLAGLDGATAYYALTYEKEAYANAIEFTDAEKKELGI